MTTWEPIGQTPTALILYDPASHALSVQRRGPRGLIRRGRGRRRSDEARGDGPGSGGRGVEGGGAVVRHSPGSSGAQLALPRREVGNEEPVDLCPYCYQPLPEGYGSGATPGGAGMQADTDTPFAFGAEASSATLDLESSPDAHALPLPLPSPGLQRTPPYFRILERAHDAASRPGTPGAPRITPISASSSTTNLRSASTEGHTRSRRDSASPERSRSHRDSGPHSVRGVEGYYARFFIEERRLGMGAEGSVYLCQHVLEGNPLGHYAVKKVAVGESSPYLFKMLREVRLLEALRHANIIPYHHVWIETTRFSSFGPPIAALHVLMMYANAGNLDSYIAARSDPAPTSPTGHGGNSPSPSSPPDAAELKRRFRSRRASELAARVEGNAAGDGWDWSKREEKRETRAVMLLSGDEIGSLFGDVANGLAFLHANSILHLDLKCSNVLLHVKDGQLIPTAMISDFGTSVEMLNQKRERTGHTGTMEYMAPESVFPDDAGRYRQSDSTADMWSLGLILHKMLFFRLPYDHDDTFTELERQIKAYQGFTADHGTTRMIERRGLPNALLPLLERLVSLESTRRPTAEKVVKAWAEMQSSQAGRPTRVDEHHMQIVLPLREGSPAWLPEGEKTPKAEASRTPFAILPPDKPATEAEPIAALEPNLVVMGKVALACVKLASLLHLAPQHPTFAYLGILLSVLDLVQRDGRVSLGLNLAHAAILGVSRIT